jgi:cytosine/uracil/thiamine/allantoin permease
MRRGRYDTTSLALKRGGVYWRNGGVNWRALVALGLGMFAAMTWIDAAFYFPAYSPFFSNRTHGADFSWLFGFVVSAVVYYLLSLSSVSKEALAGPKTVAQNPVSG